MTVACYRIISHCCERLDPPRVFVKCSAAPEKKDNVTGFESLLVHVIPYTGTEYLECPVQMLAFSVGGRSRRLYFEVCIRIYV